MLRDFVRIVPLALQATAVFACSSDPPCEDDASSCPSNCAAYSADRLNASGSCFEAAPIVGCHEPKPQLPCPMSINCRVRTATREVFKFYSGCYPSSDRWRDCTASELDAYAAASKAGHCK